MFVGLLEDKRMEMAGGGKSYIRPGREAVSLSPLANFLTGM